MIIGITIGYSFLQQSLLITGTSKIKESNWDVHFESINIKEGSVEIDENDSSLKKATIDSTNKTRVEYSVLLNKPGDFYEFTVKAVNAGTIDAMIEKVQSTILVNDVDRTDNLPEWFNYTITYEDGESLQENQIILSGKSETYKVRMEFIKDITNEQYEEATESIISIDMEVKYIQMNSNGVEVSHSKPLSIVEKGDYIYLEPDLETYTINSSETGYENSQSIKPSELSLWRIIAKNDDGTIDAVSEYVTSDRIYFYGTTGYANFIGGLQNIAQSFNKDGYTKNARIMGYDGQTLTIIDTSSFDGTNNHYPSTNSIRTPTSGTGYENDNGVLGDTLYLRDYLLVKDVYGNITAQKVNTTSSSSYWIASRKYTYDFSGEFTFNGRMTTSGLIFEDELRKNNKTDWVDSGAGYPVRPIITIKSNIKISEGTGSKSSPFVLTK